MNEIQKSECRIYNRANSSETETFKENIESFTISSEEAAQILGVNRSRLSQLTSKGIFLFERRKIDTRNRLFYRLSDLLNHQRSQLQSPFHEQPSGNSITLKNQTLPEAADINSIKNVSENNNKYLIMHSKKEKQTPKLKNTATEIFLSNEKAKDEIITTLNINFVKETVLKQEEEIQRIRALITKEEVFFRQKHCENKSHYNRLQSSLLVLQKEIQSISYLNEELESKLNSLIQISTKKKHWKRSKKPKFISKLATRC